MEKIKSENSHNIIKKILQLIIFLGLGFFFIWLSMKDLTPEDKNSMLESIKGINNFKSWFFLTLSLLAGALAHYFRALRNILMMEPMGYKLRKTTSFYSVMVCYFANLAFPRLGEVLRCSFIQRYEKIPFQKTLGTIVAERAIDMLVWLCLLVIAVLLNTSALSELVINKETGQTLGTWLDNMGTSWLGNYKLYVGLAILVVLFVVAKQTEKYWKRFILFVKIKNLFHGVWQGLISTKNVKHPYLFALYTLGIWVCFFFGTYLCFFAFDFLSHLGIFHAFALLVFGSIGFMIAQGGLGAYPLIAAGLLVLYGINYEAALAAGWVGWLVQTMMVIIFGLISLLLASLSERSTKN